VAAVRSELAAIEPARQCCRAAERAGLGRAARGRAPSPAIGRLAVRLGGPIDGDPEHSVAFDWPAAPVHCRRSYLRGLFLSRGSLSLAHGRTHLEIVVPAGQLDSAAAQLAEVGLPAGARLRRGRGVLTWKSADTVTTFLRFVGGTAATLELESRFVTRALRGHLNRALNAETANLQRSVATARRQLAAIDALAASGELERLPRMVRNVAEARRREPEATFTEIADRVSTSRALVQRAFDRLEARALQLEQSAR
jgi:cell division protein WhiA